jgi:tetratricopeptide (TPR) repeat protein
LNPDPSATRRPCHDGPALGLLAAWPTLARVLPLVAALWLNPGAANADALAEVRALSAQGDAASALRRVEAAMAADPSDVQLRFLRGVLLIDLQRDAEALAHFQQMSLEFPELPDPYNNLALLYARAGQLDEARVALETALRNDPGHRTARANLAQIYLMLAARALETLLAQSPTEARQQRRLDAVRALIQEQKSGKPD